MRPKEIKILADKYFEAETTLEEEKVLREYFRQPLVATELEHLKVYFNALESVPENMADDHIEDEIMDYILEHESTEKGRYRKMWLIISGVAASLLIAVGGLLYFQQPHAYPDTFSDAVEARAYAVKTLVYVSDKYNDGLAQLHPIGKLDEALKPLENGMNSLKTGFSKMSPTFEKEIINP